MDEWVADQKRQTIAERAQHCKRSQEPQTPWILELQATSQLPEQGVRRRRETAGLSPAVVFCDSPCLSRDLVVIWCGMARVLKAKH